MIRIFMGIKSKNFCIIEGDDRDECKAKVRNLILEDVKEIATAGSAKGGFVILSQEIDMWREETNQLKLF